jgi:hypothetical protein
MNTGNIRNSNPSHKTMYLNILLQNFKNFKLFFILVLVKK